MQEPTRASLGCGTLILIALIVMIFSNGNRGVSKELTRQIRELQIEVRELKADIKTQSATLDEIKNELRSARLQRWHAGLVTLLSREGVALVGVLVLAVLLVVLFWALVR